MKAFALLEDTTMMEEFTLRPYVGADPITFEMSPSRVEALLGKAHDVRQNDLRERIETRDAVRVVYSADDGNVAEIAFLPGTRLLFDGRLLFEEPDLLDLLMKHDPQPFEFVGFLMFFDLGITITGFHDQDEAQKAIVVYRKGRLDQFRTEAVPYNQR